MATPIDFEVLIAQVEGLEGKAGKNISKNYKKGLEQLREIIRKKYDSYAVAGELTYEEMAKYGRRKKLNKEVREAMKDLWVENAAETRKSVRSIYKTSFKETKELVEEAADQVIQGKYKREMAQEALQNPISGLTLNERLRRRRRDIITRIQETIGQGMMDNETYSQMSSRLKESLEQDYSKAMRVVRTESHRVAEQAKRESLEYANNQGIELKKYWIPSGDDRVRGAPGGRYEDAAANHSADGGMGEKYSEDNAIPIDEDFVNDETGGSGPTPGQLGTAEDDIHDRCVAGYIVVTDD